MEANGNGRAVLRRIAHQAMVDRGLLPDFSAEVLGQAARIEGPAVAPDGSVHVFTPTTGERLAFPQTNAVAAALGDDGVLWLATTHQLLREKDRGTEVVFDASPSTFRGLTVIGARPWAQLDAELLTRAGQALRVTRGLRLPFDTRLYGSTSGDVWALTDGALKRYAEPVTGDEAVFRERILPISARVCSSCHGTSGTSGIVIATYAQWNAKRARIHDRVRVKKDMPQGIAMSDAERAVISAWATSMP